MTERMVTIRINGGLRTIPFGELSRRDLIAMAGYHRFPDPLIVTYRGRMSAFHGEMRDGYTVAATEGAQFTVTPRREG